jgi:hypothetical protein
MTHQDNETPKNPSMGFSMDVGVGARLCRAMMALISLEYPAGIAGIAQRSCTPTEPPSR